MSKKEEKSNILFKIFISCVVGILLFYIIISVIIMVVLSRYKRIFNENALYLMNEFAEGFNESLIDEEVLEDYFSPIIVAGMTDGSEHQITELSSTSVFGSKLLTYLKSDSFDNFEHQFKRSVDEWPTVDVFIKYISETNKLEISVKDEETGETLKCEIYDLNDSFTLYYVETEVHQLD